MKWMVCYLSWCSSSSRILRRHPSRFFATKSDISIYDELEDIASRLMGHDRNYYESPDGTMIITDAEYDALAEREALLCQEYPEVWKEYQDKSGLGIQATRYQGRVGSRPDNLAAVSRKHAAKLLSLDNVHDTEQILAWLERVRKKITATTNELHILSEPKLDGLSVALRYDTTLQWAATRGDGTTGTDVTKAIDSIPNIPRSIPSAVSEVRGEVILPPSLAGDFSNARNAASGILFRKKEDVDNMRSQLRFYAYDTVPTMQNMREALIQWGFTVPNPAVVSTLPASDEPYTERQIQPLLDYTDKVLSLRNDPVSEFETDGCVHKIVDTAVREALGSSQRAPRWAVAHKFPPIAKVTELQDIIVQVGRTGVLTPVALLSPVDILGVNIQRATLHNFEHLQTILKSNTSIPKNSTVMVRRAGDVIPQVVSLVHKSKEKDSISLVLPKNCPDCGSPIVVDDAKAIRCSGATWVCPPQAIGALQHAFSRDALDIKGLSSAKLAQLRVEGFVLRPSDLFELAKNQTKLKAVKELEGWGDKSADKLAFTVNQTASRAVTFSRFLYSLGIPTVGLNAAKLLSEIYGSWDEMLKDLEEASTSQEEECSFERLREETDATKGIGPILVGHLWTFAKTPKLVEAAIALANNLSIAEVLTKGRAAIVDGPFSDVTVVFAGTISKELSRKEAQQLARDLGSKATPTKLTKSTGLLVCGPRSGTKRKEAETLGVSVMDGDEFLRIVEEHRASTPGVNMQADEASATLEQSDRVQEEAEDGSLSIAPFSGTSVVFTGSVAKDCSRSNAQEIARKLGATSTPSQVTKGTGIVVEGEKAASSKLNKAASFGVQVMSAVEFLQIARDNNLVPPAEVAQPIEPESLDTAVPDDVLSAKVDNQKENRPFEGFSVVFSGSVSKEITKNKAHAIAKALGASATPSKVSSRTNLVVVGARASKPLIAQAESLQIRIMTAQEFLQLVDEQENP